jgi:hypothetical protein
MRGTGADRAGHFSRDIARERRRVVDSAPTWNCFADKPVLLAIVAAYRAVVPRWTCASRPCVLRASCVNRSFSVVGVFVKPLGAPPLVTTTTRRPLVGVPRALFLPLPAMLEGMRITARSCVSRGRGRVNKRKVLAPAKKSCRRISTCWQRGRFGDGLSSEKTQEPRSKKYFRKIEEPEIPGSIPRIRDLKAESHPARSKDRPV